MGLFSALFRDPQTKAEWDKKIMTLNNELASAKASLAEAKKREQNARRNHQNVAYSYDTTYWQKVIEGLKAKIANAKIQRRNAPN